MRVAFVIFIVAFSHKRKRESKRERESKCMSKSAGWRENAFPGRSGEVFFLTSPFIDPIGVAGIEPAQLGQERDELP